MNLSGAPLLTIVFLGISVAGCTTMDNCSTPVGDSKLTPSAAASPLHYDEVVTWGGRLAAIDNDADETWLEVIGYAMDSCGRPTQSDRSQGRFIVRKRGFLEPSDYRPGREVTVTGRIASPSRARGPESAPNLPLLIDPVIRLWPDRAQAVFVEEGWHRPLISVGIGGGSGHVGGGIGISF